MYTNRYLPKQHGFTLLELMITVIIMAILAAIALPSYQRYVTKAHLEEAKSVLNQNYLWLDKMYNKHNGYYKDLSKNLITKSDLPFKSSGNGNTSYEFSLSSACTTSSSSAITANAFCLKGEPKPGQANSSGGGKECGTIMVDQSGQYYIQPQKNGAISTTTINNGITCF